MYIKKSVVFHFSLLPPRHLGSDAVSARGVRCGAVRTNYAYQVLFVVHT